MSQFIRLAAELQMPPEGEVREFVCGGKTLCVARLSGVLTAMDGICPHRGGPLGMGTLEHGRVVCPWHGWEVDIATGANNHNSQVRQARFALKLEAGDVLVELPDDPSDVTESRGK